MNTNLKLVTVSMLIEANALEYEKEWCAAVLERIEDNEDLSDDMYGLPIPELVDYFAQLDITPQLDQVNKLSLDGGRDIYQLASYFWDGADDVFDITSLEGIEVLANLETIHLDVMVSGPISLKPLVALQKLRHLNLTYAHFTNYEALQEIPSLEKVTLSYVFDNDVSSIVEALDAKGMEVKVD
ncbi:MAG: DUF6892 domain-containing protein [Aureispira sp.]